MIEAVVFDLDGVLVSTDEFHYLAWKRMASEEGIPFDREKNHRLRGVSREESLEIILEDSEIDYTQDKKRSLMDRKNTYYREYLDDLEEKSLLEGALETITGLRERGLLVAVASSSKNAPKILEKLHLKNAFDAVVDGNMILHGKPHPEVFLKAVEALGCECKRTIVVEDAESGIEAAQRAGTVAVAIGAAKASPWADHVLEELRGLLSLVDRLRGVKKP